MLTKELMIRCLPPKYKGRLTDENVDNINATLTDCEHRDAVRSNILGFTSVLNSPHYSLAEYINAVKYITYTMTGDVNVKAWAKTFPDRYTRLVAKGTEPKDINAHVRHYNMTKLVNEVREQSLTPSHILNADVYQKAINKQLSLMNTAKSEKVQQDAANSLLMHLKRPETQKIELDIGIKEDSMLTELKDVTNALAMKQLALIQAGHSVKDIAHQEILINPHEGEVVNGN